jgi:HAD superfamily hydrolase (TIGR01549 family)
MPHLPILLFDFDGVVITQKALEYTALKFLNDKFYNWKNTEELRLIDLARLFEEGDSSNRIKAILNVFKIFKRYIPMGWKRVLFFILFRRMYPKLENAESFRPFLEEVLKKFKQNHIPMAIVSNTSKERLEFFRRKLNLDDYFVSFVSRDDTPYRKPDPYPIHEVLKKVKETCNIHINKDLVYLIGDLPSDMISAKNARIKSVALTSGHGRKEDLIKQNPDIVLDDIRELLKHPSFVKFLLN